MSIKHDQGNELHDAVIEFCKIVMDPLVKYLLAAGVTYKEFEAVTKYEFVRVAAEEFGIDGRETNNSRISVLTGIPRKEVAKIKSMPDLEQIEFPKKFHALSTIMSKWATDKRFLNEENKPRILDIRGEGITFLSLVKEIGIDIPFGAILYELERNGSVSRVQDNKVKFEDLTFRVPINDVEGHIWNGYQARSLFEVFLSNIKNSSTPDLALFSKASGANLPKHKLQEFRTELRPMLMNMLENTMQWLEENQLDPDDGEGVPVKIGVFMNIENWYKHT